MKSFDELVGTITADSREQEDICTLLIDGDIVAYRPAAATDGRFYTIKDQVGRWKYKKEVDEVCKKKGLSPKDIIQSYEPEPIEHALAAVKMQVRSILASMRGHYEFIESEYYMTDSTKNFRLEINPDYKANRKGVRKPSHLAACKGYLEQHHDAEYCGYMEADDKISIRATELRAEGKDYVVCSIDKDLNQIPGWHFDWVKDKYWFVDDKMARESLWKQVCVGDRTDNIFVPEGIGPAKANKLFVNIDWELDTDDELYKRVVGLYTEFLSKCGKAKKDKGILPVTDFTDVRCWVEQTMSQVLLLREDR